MIDENDDQREPAKEIDAQIARCTLTHHRITVWQTLLSWQAMTVFTPITERSFGKTWIQ